MTDIRADLDPLVRGLLRPEAYDHPTRDFEVLETHISWVILTGDFAYKLKKPIDFGFVDFLTLEKRQYCCEEELRLNRRLTRDLYLSVKPIFGPRERATFRGTGTPIEFAVQMRQFPQSDLLPNVLSRSQLTPESLDRLASDVAEFQRRAPKATAESPFGAKDSIHAAMEENLATLEKGLRHTEAVGQLRRWAEREYAQCESVLARRKSEGMIREGHGDMHLGNMIFRDGAIEVFDCLEFNPELRWIDTISEVAFLSMDLADRGRPDLGWRFLNEWLTRTGDYACMAVWAWYFCYRALVRAKVAVLRRHQPDVTKQEARHLDQQFDDYFNLARRTILRPPPKLILTHGVSGSGKSYWARRIASECGLVWIRSDVERKRYFAAQTTGRELYSAETTAETYRILRDLAQVVLTSGWSVIVDATFLARSQREPFRELAVRLGLDCELISFRADEATLRTRILDRQRSGCDPSDATLDVLDRQLRRMDPILAEEGWRVLHVDMRSAIAGDRLVSTILESVDNSCRESSCGPGGS